MPETIVPYLVVPLIAIVNVGVYLANENSVLRFWVNREGRLLRCTNKKETNSRPTEFLCWDILDPEHMVTGVVPYWAMLSYRIAAFAFFGFTLLFQGLWGTGFAEPPLVWLIYFTNWTFVGYGLYSALGIAVLLWKYLYHAGSPVSQWPALLKCFLLIFETICSSALFLTLFYWAVVYEGGEIEFDNVARHGLNVIILLGDLLIFRIPVVTYHFQVAFSYSSVYAVFLWIYYGLSGDWVYTALNWHNTSALLFYAAIPILNLFGFVTAYATAWFRERYIVRTQLLKRYSSLDAGGRVEIQLGEVVNTQNAT